MLVQTIIDQAEHGEGQYNASLDGAYLPNGLYFVKVQIGENFNTYPINKT